MLPFLRIIPAVLLLVQLAKVDAYFPMKSALQRHDRPYLQFRWMRQRRQRGREVVLYTQKEGKSMLELAKERAAAIAASGTGESSGSSSSISGSVGGSLSSSSSNVNSMEGKLELKDDFPKRFKVAETDPNEIRREAVRKAAEERQKTQKEEGSSVDTTTTAGAIFGSLNIDDLNSRMQESTVNQPRPLKLERKEEDLNGIEPYKPFQFSVVAGFMAYVGWKLTIYMTDNFGVSLLDSEYYPVQRFTIVARNIIIGLTTIFASFSGCIAIGLIGLGIAVSIGVAKGELDPTVERKDTQLSEEKLGQIQSITDVFNSLTGADNNDNNTASKK